MKLSVVPLFCLLLALPQLANAQKEVPQDINLTGATIIEFNEPYRELVIFAAGDEDGRHSLVLIQDTTLVLKKSAFAKKKKSIKRDEMATAADFKPGMKVNLSLDYYQISQRNLVKRISLDEAYYGPASAVGLFERLDSNTAIIDGQPVRLALGKKEFVEGLDEWKGKKFMAFADMQLGAKLDLSGERRPDGIIYATRGTMQPAEGSREARLLRRAIAPEIIVSNGNLIIADGWTFKLLANSTVQEYVSSVGRKLIPQYLSRLAPVHPDFIGFAFHVVDEASTGLFSYPNGTVVVPMGLLRILDNEAQLATLLSHEIAHITHKHAVQQLRQNANWEAVQTFGATGNIGRSEPTPAVVTAAVGEMSVAVFTQSQETQADRIGLNYAVQAGYDPREAATIWKRLAELTTNDLLAAQRTAALNWLQQRYKSGSYAEANRNADASAMQPVFPGHAYPLDRFRHVNFLISTSYVPTDMSRLATQAASYKAMVGLIKNGNTVTAVSVPPVEKPIPVVTKTGKAVGGRSSRPAAAKPTIKPAAIGKPTIKSLPVKD